MQKQTSCPKCGSENIEEVSKDARSYRSATKQWEAFEQFEGYMDCVDCDHCWEPDARPEPRSITIIGRRWFQKSHGNTYHTADILIDGEQVHTTPQQYGYGDSYVDAASAWLRDNGHIDTPRHANGSHQPLWQYCRERGIALHCTATDVTRERDL